MTINPNSDRDYVDQVDIAIPHNYPKFFNAVRFDVFRHIKNLALEFKSPITIITGSNKVGKTTILQTIACSHYNFNRRNAVNGNLERARWGNVMKFTPVDSQTEDWTYYVSYREGTALYQNKRGQRKANTRKWNGVAKKESQIGTPDRGRDVGRAVVLIDIERIMSAKNLPNSAFLKAQQPSLTPLNDEKKAYISYILEQQYEISTLCSVSDKELYGYVNDYQYSSYNTASGEDVLTRIICDIVDAPDNALILIEEIEIGLHPKIQRRLMEVIYHESKAKHKQFVITTHSGNVLSAVDSKSRIFIENNNGRYKAIPEISINAALSKMDSATYPLIDLFIEDEIAKKIVLKIIDYIINDMQVNNFNQLINIVITNDAETTYQTYQAHKNTYDQKKVKCGYACILDGDMSSIKKRGGSLKYPPEEGLFFLYDNKAPERFLVSAYLEVRPNPTLQYHVNNSNAHCLLNKIVENGFAADPNTAFDLCWGSFATSPAGQEFINNLAHFLIERCKKFSPDL